MSIIIEMERLGNKFCGKLLMNKTFQILTILSMYFVTHINAHINHLMGLPQWLKQ